MGSVIGSLNGRLVGRGRDVVVLSHGFGGDQGVWDPFVAALSDRYRVLTYDLASSGLAHPDAFDLRRHGDLTGYVEDVEALLRAFGVERCHFVGHSMSGLIGVVAAARRPGRFSSLTLIGGSPRYLDDGEYRGGFQLADMAAMIDAIAADFRQWVRDVAPMFIARPAEDPAAVSFIGSLRRMRPDIALNTLKTALSADVRALLPACTMPALLLQTRNDVAVPLSVAEYMATRLPDARLEILDVEGHLPHLVAPDLVIAPLLQHLARFAGGADAGVTEAPRPSV